MTLAILFANESEGAETSKKLGKSLLQKIFNIEVRVYKVLDFLVYFVYTNSDLINISSILTKLICLYDITHVLNAGFITAVQNDSSCINKLVVVKEVEYYYGNSINKSKSYSLENNMTSECCQLLDNHENIYLLDKILTIDQATIKDKYDEIFFTNNKQIVGIDCELFAIAQICKQNKIVCSSLKIINSIIESNEKSKNAQIILSEIVPELVKYILIQKKLSFNYSTFMTS